MDGKQIVLIMVLGCVSMNAYGAADDIAKLQAELKECNAARMLIKRKEIKKWQEEMIAIRVRQSLASSSLDDKQNKQVMKKERKRYERALEMASLKLVDQLAPIDQRINEIFAELLKLGRHISE